MTKNEISIEKFAEYLGLHNITDGVIPSSFEFLLYISGSLIYLIRI